MSDPFENIQNTFIFSLWWLIKKILWKLHEKYGWKISNEHFLYESSVNDAIKFELQLITPEFKKYYESFPQKQIDSFLHIKWDWIFFSIEMNNVVTKIVSFWNYFCFYKHNFFFRAILIQTQWMCDKNICLFFSHEKNYGNMFYK